MINSQTALTESVVIRLADDDDDSDILECLAALDSALPPTNPVLIAERGGQPVAALGLSRGEAIANPFLPTADVVELLRLRASQVQTTSVHAGGLFRRAAASGNPVRHARNRLHRLLEGAHVPV